MIVYALSLLLPVSAIMFWTSLCSTPTIPAIPHSLQKLLPKRLPPSLAPTRSGTLYEILSKTPSGGVGKHVHQTRWSKKKIPDCFWVVTRTKFKCEGKHGKAWGKLVWRGKVVSTQEERIRGSLKYKWAEGRSEFPETAP
ncbi:hypothetical protein E1B28_004064 [Marasmius oreades]|uniref:Uncharacterized protein n=1 Tax=Marasmius oreades TaxID=181124 RepID=A0A9P7UY15_9AGAR|nr:uncharacterized protein E1B28_004064 [Marasmius oreades]KAG7096648.1 hypothetical protein E1B28_004064 [Marasmius oreades]